MDLTELEEGIRVALLQGILSGEAQERQLYRRMVIDGDETRGEDVLSLMALALYTADGDKHIRCVVIGLEDGTPSDVLPALHHLDQIKPMTAAGSTSCAQVDESKDEDWQNVLAGFNATSLPLCVAIVLRLATGKKRLIAEALVLTDAHDDSAISLIARQAKKVHGHLVSD